VAVDSYYNESSLLGIEDYVCTISHIGYNLMIPLTKIINFNVQVFLDKLKSISLILLLNRKHHDVLKMYY